MNMELSSTYNLSSDLDFQIFKTSVLKNISGDLFSFSLHKIPFRDLYSCLSDR